jgi:ribose transport system ATP-binding protein
MTGHIDPATQAKAEAARPLIEMHEISKSFAGNRALTAFNLSLDPGEVHVLIGANGSGKSTLIKILSGFHHPDPGGQVQIGGTEFHFGSSAQSYALGCRFVHQDLGLVSALSVLDNLNLGDFPTRFGTIRGSQCRATTKEMLDAVGVDLEPSVKVSELSAARRTGVALARAMRADPRHPARLLVLDEPTATLPPSEVNQLLAMVRSVAAGGVAVLFVTHHMDEVERIGDSVSVLRDGVVVGRSAMRLIDRARLVELVAGGSVTETERPVEPAGNPDTVPPLSVEGLAAGPLRTASFTAAAGEIVGLAGLTGSGRETVLGAIFGAVPADAGRVRVRQATVPPQRPDLAMAAGVGYLPSDRKVSGGIMSMSARENITLTNLKSLSSRLLLRRSREAAASRELLDKFDVRPRGAVEQVLANFSGGNQQKILFAKWTRVQPAVLLLDEPTQGVDISAKGELHRHLLSMAAEGMAVVVSSADFDELALICNRVLVFRNGTISDELTGSRVNLVEISRSVVSEASRSSLPVEAPQ